MLRGVGVQYSVMDKAELLASLNRLDILLELKSNVVYEHDQAAALLSC